MVSFTSLGATVGGDCWSGRYIISEASALAPLVGPTYGYGDFRDWLSDCVAIDLAQTELVASIMRNDSLVAVVRTTCIAANASF